MQLSKYAQGCDILAQSIRRFERRIFPGEEIHKKRQLVNYDYDQVIKSSPCRGLLHELQVDLLNLSGCEQYPHLEVQEACKQMTFI